jgi:chromosome segregation ATPase
MSKEPKFIELKKRPPSERGLLPCEAVDLIAERDKLLAENKKLKEFPEKRRLLCDRLGANQAADDLRNERDELRAEVTRGLNEHAETIREKKILEAERDELRAEVKQLQEELEQWKPDEQYEREDAKLMAKIKAMNDEEVTQSLIDAGIDPVQAVNRTNAVIKACVKMARAIDRAEAAEAERDELRAENAKLRNDLSNELIEYDRLSAKYNAAETKLKAVRATIITCDTDSYRNAPSGIGDLANEWKDKPHRLVYDLVAYIEKIQALMKLAATQGDRDE